MKITFVNLASDRDWGGGEMWTLVTAGGLADRGHDVSVLGRRGGAMAERAVSRGLRSGTVPASVDYAPSTIGAILRWLRRERPDVVVAHHNKDVRTGGVAARLAGVPVVHRNGFPILRDAFRHRVSHALTDRILTNSVRIRDRYVAYGWIDPDRIDVVPNGIQPPSVVGDRERLRESLGVGPDELIALFAGRLTSTKRVSDLLEAVAALPSESPWTVVILGSGSQDELLRRRTDEDDLRHRARLLGYRSDAPDVMSAADLVVLPSSQEGMPNVLLEAMVRGVPVAGTPVGDVEELLDGGNAGWIVPVGDIPAWTALLADLAASPAERLRKATLGQRRVRERYTLERMLEGVERSLSLARRSGP